MFITRFFKPGKDHKAPKIESLTNPVTELNDLIKEQSDKTGQPHFWSFSSWRGGPSKANHIEASAIVLEYDKTCDFAKIGQAIRDTDLECFIVQTARGYAFIFPLDEPVLYGRYYRLVAVLAEMVGQHGLINSSPGAQHLFYVEDNQKVFHIAGETIPADFHFQTTDLSEPVETWSSPAPANPIIKAHDAIEAEAFARQRQDRAIAATTNGISKAKFDDLFDALEAGTDQLVRNAAMVQKLAAKLRQQMEGGR